ncbi:MAG: putative bifunctional diguanylate cyclase/phosphodiesterase [Sedimentibacter sp.]
MHIRKYKDKFVMQKIFIITFIIIFIAFVASVNFLLQLINNFFINDIENTSISISRNYVKRIADATESLDTINNLLDAKLELAVKAITTHHHNSNVNELIKIAYEYNIDEINIFNKYGEIYNSNNFEHIGWKTFEEHPTYYFMKSHKKIWLEDIRKDTLSDVYYKYGYYKANDGCFVQIGIMAEKYYNLIEAFEIQNLLKELNEFSYIICAHFIDNSLNMTEYNHVDDNYEFILDESKIYSINQNKEYFNKTKYGNEDAYEILLPVIYDNNKIGTLAIAYSLSDTLQLIKLGSIAGVVILMLIFTIIALMLVNINERNNKLFQLVYFDSLTGLPNKHYLNEFLKDTINIKSINKAIILVDIINFKLIYLTYGLEQGEIIFKEISQKINKLITNKEKLFRVAGNQFVIYIENYKSKEYLIEICNKINSFFESTINDLHIHNNINAKIGIIEIDNSYKDTDKILKNVEIAANSDFTDGSIYKFFNNVMEQKILRENYIESEIRKFIDYKDNNIIYLEYQPQLELRTNKISGFEGLARMKTEKLGQISPAEFIDIAEKRNLILQLGLMLLRKACTLIKCIEKQEFKNVTVAVNVSTIQILREDFYDNVMKIIEETGIDPNYLELELTESVFMDNFDIVNINLLKLKEAGIKISLDDFGTGYSSLDRIKELHIDTIKIDKLFIDSLITSNPSEVITGDIISFVHKMGLNTVAEGVELQEQKEYLETNNCDIIQGFLFSKPISHDKALEILNRMNK